MNHGLHSIVGLAIGLALAAACSDPNPTLLCAAGSEVACQCDDGSLGTALCATTNIVGPCVCDGADTGLDADADTDTADTADTQTDTEDADTGPDGADLGPTDTDPGDAILDGDTAHDTDDVDAHTDDVDADTGGEPDPACPEVPGPRDPYLGCEFWSVDLPIYDDPFFDGASEQAYGVVITNPGAIDVDVTFTAFQDGVVAPDPVTVGPGSSSVVELPRMDTAGTEITSESIRIRTSGHVAVAQFNPLDADAIASGDASLLLPVRSLGTRYRIATGEVVPMAGLPALEPQRAFATIVAVADGTTRVTVTPTMAVDDGAGITDWAGGVERTFELDQGQVLDLAFHAPDDGGRDDPSGTGIVAERPVAVFCGHEQAIVGSKNEAGGGDLAGFADHQEIQLPPESAWGTTYVAAHGPSRGDERDTWVIVAAQDSTILVATPAIAGIDGVVLAAGQFVRAETSESFVLTASAPVMAARMLAGQAAWGVAREVGDPALSVLRPPGEFSTELIGWAPSVPGDALEAWLTIVAPADTAVFVNGVELAIEPTTVAGWDIHHAAARGGTNVVDAGAPVGAMLTLFTDDAGIELPLAGAR